MSTTAKAAARPPRSSWAAPIIVALTLPNALAEIRRSIR
jgi:hypothetical protein